MLLVSCVLPQLALAAITINVSTRDDVVATDGLCSLREAISVANGQPSDCLGLGGGGGNSTTINLPAGVYTLALAGAGEDANATGHIACFVHLTCGAMRNRR